MMSELKSLKPAGSIRNDVDMHGNGLMGASGF
jgi:hypothetical protein